MMLGPGVFVCYGMDFASEPRADSQQPRWVRERIRQALRTPERGAGEQP
jgi:hypothetical protein